MSVPSISRGSIPDIVDPSHPAVVIFSSATEKIVFYSLKAPPNSEIFDYETHDLTKNALKQVAAFVSSVSQVKLKSGSIALALQGLKGGLEPDVWDLLMTYMDEL